ncbi:MAG: hypothetical protein ABL953_06315 [Ilumatobacteraceae bacterium]
MSTMKVLLIESSPNQSGDLSDQLVSEGHEVVQCADEHGGPCRGVDHHADCPLEQGVDLAVLTREPKSPQTLTEMGSVCAQRHRVPLVVVDPSQLFDELPSVSVASALANRVVESGYAAAVRRELAHLPIVVDVSHLVDRVVVKLQLPASENTPAARSAAADRARFAVRTHDPFVQTIDISVVCYPD